MIDNKTLELLDALNVFFKISQKELIELHKQKDLHNISAICDTSLFATLTIFSALMETIDEFAHAEGNAEQIHAFEREDSGLEFYNKIVEKMMRIRSKILPPTQNS